MEEEAKTRGGNNRKEVSCMRILKADRGKPGNFTHRTLSLESLLEKLKVEEVNLG